MTERDWERYVEDREAAEIEERWLESERRDWAQAVIEKLEAQDNELSTSSGRGDWIRGARWGIQLALSYLKDTQ